MDARRVNISGATSSTYTVVEADEGHLLRVVETATDSDGGPATTSTSAPTSAVTDIPLAFTTAASITGTAQEGQMLTAVNGTLNDSDAAVTGYQWTRDGVNIGGATSSTYTVVEADEGHLLQVVETATDSDGGPATTSTSAPTSAVTATSSAGSASRVIRSTAPFWPFAGATRTGSVRRRIVSQRLAGNAND
jgi:Major Vault Protein repeat domain